MAASRPWESQTAPPDVKDRAAPAKSAGRAASPRMSISVHIPTTPTGRSILPAGAVDPDAAAVALGGGEDGRVAPAGSEPEG